MAIPIRSVPVLEGEVARRFIKEAKENEKNAVRSNFRKKILLLLYVHLHYPMRVLMPTIFLNNRKKKLTENIPHEKSLSSYPATLIGRLGVNKDFSGKGVGRELLDYIKQWMLLSSNLTACRYLTVDAYNNVQTLKFYEANGFKPIFSSETQEKEYMGFPLDKELKTSLMYFDLILLK